MKESSRNRYKAIVPNFFTIGNMLCGFSSVIYSFNQDFMMAMWMILAGATFDSLDGKIARYLNSASDFGVEYDSLSDVITFGAAPSFMVYNAFFSDQLTPATLLSFLPLLFGSIRLARFNADLVGFDKEVFKGLPIPLSALTISSAVVFWINVWPGKGEDLRLFIAVLVLVSILMVSKIKYPTLPNFGLKHARKIDMIVFFLIAFSIISILIWREVVIFPILLLFVLSGVFYWLFDWLNTNRKTNAEI
jgi:CDP-diacylglycerol---serine O-phosphatidyltransferase